MSHYRVTSAGSAYPLEALTGRVVGAAIEVHKELGPGYVEATYEDALAVELTLRGIPFLRQHPVHLTYKGHAVGESRLDFVVDEVLVVELKAVELLLAVHTAQLISYLKATHTRIGLLLNFNVPLMKEGVKRVILD